MWFRTRAEKRRSNRRIARWLFVSMGVVTVWYCASIAMAWLIESL